MSDLFYIDGLVAPPMVAPPMVAPSLSETLSSAAVSSGMAAGSSAPACSGLSCWFGGGSGWQLWTLAIGAALLGLLLLWAVMRKKKVGSGDSSRDD
jgi:hypothetical protein